MKKITSALALFLLLYVSAYITSACERTSAAQPLRYSYPDIFDLSYTPDSLHRCTGWFTDAGAWFGFTPPEKNLPTGGFCGPFSLDMNRRQWVAKSAVSVSLKGEEPAGRDSVCFFPGELRLMTSYPQGRLEQRLNFVTSGSALLTIMSPSGSPLQIRGLEWAPGISLTVEGNNVLASHPSGETIVITFNPDVDVKHRNESYLAITPGRAEEYVVISMFDSEDAARSGIAEAEALLRDPAAALCDNNKRWDGYLRSILRDDMPADYDRIAVKAITTLVSNHRAARGGLLHDGIIPSHAVDYFVGLWAWDSWRFCAGAASFDPELAKNNIRAMFDYQLPDGMIIDCIYTDPAENNARNSKPPLVAWAVDKIYEATDDKEFLAEMYPQLMNYYRWWFEKRDHDGNGICEYGSTDGTLEAAAWESGMDNAIRFDDTEMVSNGVADAWSMNQESVDLNAYLSNECKYLKKFADILGTTFDAPDMAPRLRDYFYDTDRKFFFDRNLDGNFVGDPGCEAYTMLWTGVATPEQVAEMLPVLQDTAKFSTYIPFPTVAADNPKYNPRGYWRGPIWLDQTYFAISGLRNYGYNELADDYTRKVFERLEGLNEGGPIHENYDTHTGKCLKAPHFSWSASHLIMLYNEYGK